MNRQLIQIIEHLNAKIEFNADLLDWILNNSTFPQSDLNALSEIIERREIMLKMEDILKDIDLNKK